MKVTKKYSMVSNELLNNENISLKAKGLFAYMLSKPGSWNFTYKGMCKQLKESESAIASGIKELKDYACDKQSEYFMEEVKKELLNLSETEKKRTPKQVVSFTIDVDVLGNLQKHAKELKISVSSVANSILKNGISSLKDW